MQIFVLGDEEESDYKAGIKLDVDDLVINGNGYTIDACGKTQIFHCTGKNIILKNITLKNGNTAEKGGAIYNHKGELTVTDSTFTDNTAKQSGGAIYNWKGVLNVSDSTFTENTSKFYGGAIYNDGVLIVSDSTFTKNTAVDGGVISNCGELTVSDSTLTENTAVDGGAIYNRNGVLIVSDSTLTENTASSGGAIYNDEEGNFKVFNCNFLNNKSPASIIMNIGLLQISNSNFMGNCASNIIVNNGDLANVGIFNGEFKDNNINESIIFNDGKSCTVEKTIFEKHPFNTIINESDLTLISPKIKDEGEVILNEKYILIKSLDELEDKIYGDGIIDYVGKFEFKEFDFGYLDKKIHESKNKEIILEEDISFENYEIDYYGGGIELDIDNLIIDGNGHTIDAKGKTRMFYCTGKNIIIKNLTLKNGHSHINYDNPFNSNGGAIKINHNTKLTIKNCKLINNASEEYGGSINNNGELTVFDSTFTENTAKYDGGAIKNKGVLIVSDSTFTENTGGRGGAINNNGVLTVSDSTLTENTASSGGGQYI